MNLTAHASHHDADGEYCWKLISEDELRLMTVAKLLRPRSRTLEGGKKLVEDFGQAVEPQHQSSWASLEEVWKARNVLMHQFKWNKWSARTLWVVK